MEAYVNLFIKSIFIENMIKPDYNHWEGKEAFELRFLKCLESNF